MKGNNPFEIRINQMLEDKRKELINAILKSRTMEQKESLVGQLYAYEQCAEEARNIYLELEDDSNA